MIRKNLVVNTHELVMNHESQTVKLNPASLHENIVNQFEHDLETNIVRIN